MNYRNIFRYCLMLPLLLLAACSSNDDVFDKSPSQRSSESIASLKDELVNAPHGWRVIYFPKTDSLLFSNPSELIPHSGFRGRYGYGGDCFTMKFNADNTVEMRADYTAQSVATAQRSEYLVSRNSYTQLSFITYNYLHQLVNDRFAGSSVMWVRMRMENWCSAQLPIYSQPVSISSSRSLRTRRTHC